MLGYNSCWIHKWLIQIIILQIYVSANFSEGESNDNSFGVITENGYVFSWVYVSTLLEINSLLTLSLLVLMPKL